MLYAVNHSVRNPFLDSVMPYITKLGDKGIFWIALAVILLIPKKTRKTGAAMGIAMLLGVIIGNGILKNLVARTRPFDLANPVVSRSRLLIDPPTDYSFPSGHTLASFEAATAIYKDHTLYGFAVFLLALLIAFSRIYLQVHYPSDVLGGAILGFLLGLLGSTIVRWMSDVWSSHKEKKAQKEAEKA
ncbi:MAG: phosphatase PAP2 family protein [Clostridia bacterium]|nr:phosphatase PAP2 family protein [Clostridia bacterium]